jgi:hypothetical protein
MLDYIIVGGGPIGLYVGSLLKDRNLKFLIIERDHIGGRVGNVTFQNTEIMIGAGIGRLDKDKLLMQLLTDLGLSAPLFYTKKTFSEKASSSRVNMKRILKLLQNKLTENPSLNNLTFRDFAIRYLSLKEYNGFVITSGFSDFENTAISDALYNYGFEDDDDEWQAFHVPWKKMVQRLANKIGHETILLGTEVTSLSILQKSVAVNTSNGIFEGRHCILATTIDTIQKLLPEKPIYKQIGGQPFLRVYGKIVSREMKSKVIGTTIVDTPLQKISRVDENVYMIAYSDNANALHLKDFIRNTHENRQMWARQLKEALSLSSLPKVEAIRGFFWEIGTHFYKVGSNDRETFLRRAQRPYPNVSVCGEVVALNQGWTNEALKTVHSIL